MGKITDIKFYGRGGQGIVTGSHILANAALISGKHVHAFPAFGPERSGAPISAYARISDQEFSIKTEIYEPEIVLVQDPPLIGTVDVAQGVEKGGKILINYSNDKCLQLVRKFNSVDDSVEIHWFDASKIALDVIKRDVPNTVMLAALSKMTGIVPLESLEEAIKQQFAARKRLIEPNLTALRRGYDEFQ
ncbi:MAG: 2-oxoacid:acceptor oxidoreductase family protein [Candidatus Odinarchaeota archaeon]